jgi:lysozyme
MIRGLDVSKSQKNVDWTRVFAAGYRWVYVKSTEGQTYLSSACADHVHRANMAGLLVGLYHFSKPDLSPRDAKKECDWMMRTHERFSADLSLLPALDLEAHDIEDEATSAWAVDFLARAKQLIGRPLPVYTYLHFLKRLELSVGLEAHPLWLACPRMPKKLPGPWPSWDAWQHTSSGRIDGINGNVDRNVAKPSFLERVRLHP